MIDRRTVVICDDSKNALSGIEQILSRSYRILKVEDRSRLFEKVSESCPGLVLLGLNSSYFDDLSVCIKMRNSVSITQTRMIVFGHLEDSEQGIEALEHGADDFIAIPFRTHNVIARVQVQLRRLNDSKSTNNVLAYENLSLDLDRLEVSVGAGVEGKKVPMSTLEFNLLKYFISNREKVLNRTRILDSVWTSGTVTPRTVDAHVVSLRKKIEGSDTVLQTVHGAGYVLRSLRSNS